ncbi:MAG: hypothetical protein IJ905_11285 [Fibrobacter sp.]|nr:hypothetical protein [Fibrobacter sp.]
MQKRNLWTLTCKSMLAFFAALMLTACGDSGNNASVDEVQWNGNKGTFTDSRDGQTYKVVAFDSLIWMAENLNYKTENSKCFDEKADKCKYGRLYFWDEALKACPAGWHLPSKKEFITMLAAVDKNHSEIDTSNVDYFIMEDVGFDLKSKNGWVTEGGESSNGSDAYGFTVLPAGFWNIEFSGFLGQGQETLFWTSTERETNFAHCTNITETSSVKINSCGVEVGFSVRCVKD